MHMPKPEKFSNIVPRGAIRLSEAFERLCRQVDPAWDDLQQRCVEWDEHPDYGVEERGEDPYPQLVASTYHSEMIFRTALRDGHLRAYVHNILTGIDFELHGREWARAGDVVGINSDYTDPDMPGPDCSLNGVLHPMFLIKADFDRWLDAAKTGVDRPAGGVRGEAPANPPVTRAFSVEDVIQRTGLSKTRIYQEIAQKNLRTRKSGVRTLILENDLDQFLRRLPVA